MHPSTMAVLTVLALPALGLAGCAAGGPPATAVDRQDLTTPEQVAESSGSQVVAIIGTPFYALFKGVTCVTSTLLAAPASAGLALTNRPDREIVQAQLAKGVGQNCGGSYVLGSS